MALTQAQRGKILGAIFAVLLVGGLAWTQLTDRSVNTRADDLRAELVDAYGETDTDDIPALFPHEDTDFFDRAGSGPDVVGQVDGGWRARYRVTAWGEHRCVVVTWTDDGAEIEEPEPCRP